MKLIWTLILLSFWFGSSPAEARTTTCRPGRCGGSGGGTTELTPEQRRMAIIIVSIGAGLSLIGGVSFCIWLKCIRKKKALVNNQVKSVLPSEAPSTMVSMYYDAPPRY